MSRRALRWAYSAVFWPLVSVLSGFLVGALAILAAGADPIQAYVALFQGAFTNHNAFAETLVSTTPYVLLGLSVALGFRAGLFNIGAEGQFYVGSLTGVFVAYSIHGLPAVIEIPLGLLGGMAGGAPLAAIAGALQARISAPQGLTPIILHHLS